jgi:lipase
MGRIFSITVPPMQRTFVRKFDCHVEGGTVHGVCWGEAGPVVLCVHGITANHTEFQWLADELGGQCRLIAPDLRGRGRSSGIPGPWGMKAHAADLAAVLDHLGIERADVLLGHSMGGFVAAVAAGTNPDRYARVLMVDGGLPLMNVSWIARLPFSDVLIERISRKILGPSLDRLAMTFPSREAYRAFWRPHPALAADWGPYVEQYIDYDLDGEPPALRPSTRKEALLMDVRTQLIENLVPQSLKRIRCPVRFLAAERGMFDGKPLYPPGRVARCGASVPDFSHATVAGVNHFTILMSQRGARAVAAEVRALAVLQTA